MISSLAVYIAFVAGTAFGFVICAILTAGKDE